MRTWVLSRPGEDVMNAEAILEERVGEYARRRQLELSGVLGFGIHGRVFRGRRAAQAGEVALKVHYRKEPFLREVAVYERLREAGVVQILDFNVPQLLASDAELLVLEMTIVQQPFVLDFAESYLEAPPEFSDDVWLHWEAEKQEQFDERWPTVEKVLGELEDLGIHMLDVSPNNIAFRDRQP